MTNRVEMHHSYLVGHVCGPCGNCMVDILRTKKRSTPTQGLEPQTSALNLERRSNLLSYTGFFLFFHFVEFLEWYLRKVLIVPLPLRNSCDICSPTAQGSSSSRYSLCLRILVQRSTRPENVVCKSETSPGSTSPRPRDQPTQLPQIRE